MSLCVGREGERVEIFGQNQICQYNLKRYGAHFLRIGEEVAWMAFGRWGGVYNTQTTLVGAPLTSKVDGASRVLAPNNIYTMYL